MKMTVLIWLAVTAASASRLDFGGVHLPASGPAKLRITIRLVNSRIVPVKTLALAQNVTGEIFSRARVEVTWLDCSGEEDGSLCGQHGGPTDFPLQMVAANPPRLSGDMAGFAILPPRWKDGEGYAGVSYPRVEATAKALDAEAADMLGATMAHEIGHLLLGAASHSASGVMCPRFQREQMRKAARGELLFTPEQAARIRAELARRMAQ
jgi:hypothetical protein